MFPGRGIDPRQIQKMMKQMGIKSEEIEADRVIIEGKGKKIIIEDPSVTAIDMQGKKTYTIMGEEREEKIGIPKEDIEMVMKQAGVNSKKAEAALKKSRGDIAEAILSLKELKGEN
ncbi:MAG: nascent polypeptide-associated complex protein [Candidatus Diapherotrites archaeon]